MMRSNAATAIVRRDEARPTGRSPEAEVHARDPQHGAEPQREAAKVIGARAGSADGLHASPHTRVREGLLRANAAAAVAADAEGIAGTTAGGQLIRPQAALAVASDPLNPPVGFWEGALAIQLAHEASLVHDDILDGAAERRGKPTAVAAGGVARALLQGDHLLTSAYRAAASTGSLEFTKLFARAVERTVAGEAAQGRADGQRLGLDRYEEIARGKAGELLGCALALAPILEGRRDVAEMFELGRRMGVLYQMLDDLLDYCPEAGSGKPALGDYAAQRWTWILEECPSLEFGRDGAEVVERLHTVDADGGSPMARCLARLAAAGDALRQEIGQRIADGSLLDAMIESWIDAGRRAVEHEALRQRRRRQTMVLTERLPAVAAADGFLSEHSRSFRFASRFFPAAEAERVARVYAFCRVTDDLVDRPPPGEDPEALLSSWIDLAASAYAGGETGLPLLDHVMMDMASAGVPFVYAEELAEGMRMDLRGESYGSLPHLRVYTYRVASVVGLWMTRLFGVHEKEILRRAERLGHAMQLTNILRDVGEDHARGRLYLPADVMARHGVTEAAIEHMCRGEEVTLGYASMVEELLCVAEADYAAAIEAIPLLPKSLGRPVAVAASVYRGIHRQIRANGYDNLRLRAYTSPATKAILSVRALFELRRAAGWAPTDAVSLRARASAGGGE